jgi:serine phosphatase RsbU (regulator of sigma subunit)/anti-sigma regulatory factor (Ser/Thr protein kinase)
VVSDNDHSRLAAALRRAVQDLHASTGIAYVPADDGRLLTAVTIVGLPVSLYTALERIRVDHERYTPAIAYRTGRQIIGSSPETLSAPSAADVTMPFPYTVASTPAQASGHMVGVLTLLWVPPLGPRQLLPEHKSRCCGWAQEMAQDLDIARQRYARARPASVPCFLLPATGDALGTDVSFLYDFQKTASALTRAVRPQDVIETVVHRIMAPFDAQSMLVGVLEYGRQRILGYTGYPPEITRSVSVPTPAEPLFLENETDLAAAHLGALGNGLRACALLPLISERRTTGTFVLGFDHPRRFTAENRAVLVSMTGLLAQSLDRARHFETEHGVVRRLQQGLLPHMLPHLEELDTAARYVPAPGTDVGGDWYDVLTLPDGNVGLVIGDVEGHSPAGAAVMGQIRSVVRAYATEGHGPADVLGRTNRLLAELGTDLFVTCTCIWLDRAAGTAEISRAGHPSPLLRLPDRTIEVAAPEPGLPLGVVPDAVYHSEEVILPPGTVLALYTDGLIHSRDTDLVAGTEALCRLLAEADELRLEELATRLLGITGEGAGRTREDDAALLLARYDGALPGAHRRVSRMSVQRHDLQGVREVRAFLHEKLRLWGWRAVSYEVELLATELVTNALVHADSDVDVRLREYPDRIRVEVRDCDPRPPLPAPITVTEQGDIDAEHGRGLVIVEAMASAWGNSPSGRGKSVWFEVTATIMDGP